MPDLCLRLHAAIIEEARKHHVPTGEASMVFFHAYEVHKKKKGSFSPTEDPHTQEHYIARMHERYHFMKEQADEFIKKYHHMSHAEREKYMDEVNKRKHFDSQAIHGRNKI